jgi:hypothetical protein
MTIARGYICLLLISRQQDCYRHSVNFYSILCASLAVIFCRYCSYAATPELRWQGSPVSQHTKFARLHELEAGRL